MNIRKTVLGTVGAISLALATIMPGAAAPTQTANIVIAGGSLSASVDHYYFNPVNFSFVDQTTTGSIKVSVSDTRGTFNGWVATLEGTWPSELNVPTNGAPTLWSAPGSQPVGQLALGFPAANTITATAAANEGSGAYSITVPLNLVIEGQTAANTYLSVAEIEIVSGP